MSDKLYQFRFPTALEPYYMAHVTAMTREGLHSKADIAAELAYRDKRISELEAKLAETQGELNRIQRIAATGTVENFLKLPNESKRLAYAQFIRESTRRKEAEDKLAEAERDAKRYRWLREFAITGEYLDAPHTGRLAFSGDTDGLDYIIDMAIDAAVEDKDG